VARAAGKREVTVIGVRVTADKEICATTGQCARTAPTVFRVSDTEHAVEVIDPEPPSELERAVREAARCCPVEAITVLD
jgi:ferredoxin